MMDQIDNREKLPDGWVLSKLGDIGFIASGGTPSTKVTENFDGDIPWLTPADLSKFNGKFIARGQRSLSEKGLNSSSAVMLPAGSILFSSRAPVGYVVIASNPICTNQGFKNLVPFEHVFNEYVFYYLKGSKQLAESLASGTTFLEISGSKFAQIPVPLPPLPEQHRIVSKIEELFTKLDAGVEELRKAKGQLRRYRQAVLSAAIKGELTKEWRKVNQGEFEPVQVLMSRICEIRKQYTIPTRANDTVRPDVSTLPGLPEGWIWTSWEQIGVSQNGRLFPSKDYCDDGIKLLRPGNLHESGIVVWNEDNTRFLPHDYAENHPAYIVGSEELVMNLTAQSLKDEFLGRICMTDPSERCLLNQRIARLTPIIVSKKYMLSVFKSKLFRRFVNGLNTGSLIQHMFTSQLASFFLPLPPLEEQEQITREIDHRFSVLQEIEKTVGVSFHRSEIIRRSILKRAFSGKLIPQNPTDEPAEKLIERISRSASKSIQTKRKRKSNGDTPHGE